MMNEHTQAILKEIMEVFDYMHSHDNWCSATFKEKVDEILTANEGECGESEDVCETCIHALHYVGDDKPETHLSTACLVGGCQKYVEYIGEQPPAPPKEAHSWIDDNDYHWEWDGNRVYCLEAEKEMMENGEDVSQNGYPASSPNEALSILMAGGYIEPTEDFYTLPKDAE